MKERGESLQNHDALAGGETGEQSIRPEIVDPSENVTTLIENPTFPSTMIPSAENIRPSPEVVTTPDGDGSDLNHIPAVGERDNVELQNMLKWVDSEQNNE